MGLFRRRSETLNEQLLREAGLEPDAMLGTAAPSPPPPVEPPKSGLAKAGVVDGSGVGPKEWDAVALTPVPGLVGKRVDFMTLPNGDVIVGQEEGNADLSPLADAIEEQLSPPYRAVASPQGAGLWGVGAKRIQVAQIPFEYGGRLELTRHGADDELRVDGERSDDGVPPELEQVGEAVGKSFYVEAGRIDGDYWEVRATAL